MNNQEYEQKLQERWEDLHSLGDSKPSAKECFDYAFAAAYALGKQEKDTEGEEMLTVSRKEVMKHFREAKLDSIYYPCDSKDYVQAIGRKIMLVRLFGKDKCLPDDAEPPLKITAAEDCVRMAKEEMGIVDDNVDSLEPKPAEPKFKVGDKVKHIAHPHDDGIYVVDDIKKSSDGFTYHIQGLIGISNVKESDLEPYAEPEKRKKEGKTGKKLENSQSGQIANCDKHFDNILKNSFHNERRLNIATTIMAGVMANPNVIKSRGDLKAISDEWLASRTLELADALISEGEKGGCHEKA